MNKNFLNLEEKRITDFNYYSDKFSKNKNSIWNIDNIFWSIKSWFDNKILSILASSTHTLKEVITNEWFRKYFELSEEEKNVLSAINIIQEFNQLNLDDDFSKLSDKLEIIILNFIKKLKINK